MKYDSTLTQVAEKVFQATNLKQAQDIITSHIGNTRINGEDKNAIMTNAMSAKSLVRLQTYMCNSLLKFEGLGINKY